MPHFYWIYGCSRSDGEGGVLFSFYETNLIDSKRVSVCLFVCVYALPLRYLFIVIHKQFNRK